MEKGNDKRYSETSPWEIDNRIPNTTYAKHYDLKLKPDLRKRTFAGEVRIQIELFKVQDYLLVHSRNLTIDRSTLNLQLTTEGQKKDVVIDNAFIYAPNEFFVVQSRDELQPGTYELYMKFNGSLAGKIVGFYYSEYSTDTRGVMPLATTKFEPTFARQAFPCFDEPSFRSTFSMKIVSPSEHNYKGLSNMPVEKILKNDPAEGYATYVFKNSVPMVTYLVCFIVSDFVQAELSINAKNGKLPFSVYAPQEKIKSLEYALHFGSETLLFYEEMFDIGFPLDKCDMAAIPDYSSGATEHWGLITFRETNILLNRNTSSAHNYQRVSSVIAHEMAHQWFGNLVTLKWWNDLWLNEGFARYIEYKGVHHEHPSWDMKSQFVVDVLQSVFDFDSKLSSHPIVKKVETPEEINAMFDTISYEKGSSVLRMMEGFMGDAFQKGINQFLKDFRFSNAVTEDLYRELTDAWKHSVKDGEKVDVGDIVNTWTMQMGYPVLSVAKNDTNFNFTQKRFLKNPQAIYNSSTSPYKFKWDIPISFVTSKDPENSVQHWLYRENESLVVNLESDVSWFKVNHRQIGYYRVLYEPDVYSELQKLCYSLTLTPEDRSSLYDDALSLADAHLLDFEVALNLTTSLTQETHFVPWTSAARKLKDMNYLLLSFPVGELFREYIKELVTCIYSKLKWEDVGSHLDRMLRTVIVDLASFSLLEASLDEAGILLQLWIDNAAYSLPLDTRKQVYWWGMIKSGSNENWEIMWQRCMREMDAAQKWNLYFGLSNSQDPETLQRYLNLTFDLNNTKMQDFLNILKSIALNPVGMDIVWDWVRCNWMKLVDRYGSDDRYLGQLIPSIANYFATEEKLSQAESFYETEANYGIALQYKDTTLETIKSNIYWVENYVPVIERWLK